MGVASFEQTLEADLAAVVEAFVGEADHVEGVGDLAGVGITRL